MPGHIKLGKAGEPDPDPLPYLVVNMEDKRKDMLKTYDSKKSYWCPDMKGGFTECMLENDDGTKATVMVGHEKKVFKSDEVAQVNPPKFTKCEDMANLTYLNEASVFHNLDVRFKAKLIYTYSGLFCVVVNPYKRYPIYTPTVVKLYLGKRRNEVPPHLWAITETAYRNMVQNTKNQSMLITGESGAGKTENTKKVISYLAQVAASGKKQAGGVSLEDQIVATNPILESYGNAKTARNDNSSRFGKFIRIYFNASGKLAGCDIESYLLEKSRITQQQEVERSYHMFYQLLMPAVPDMKAKCLVTDDIYDYSFVSQGKTSVPSIDDNEELEFTHDAFRIIGFTDEETWDCYKLTAGVMSCGEMKFKQKGRDDQAEADDLTFPKKVAELFGVHIDEMMKAFCKPKIKVGTEWVVKGQTCDQAHNAVGAIARSVYDRIFKWLIIKCNETLIDKKMKKANFCAVLDIAGFEIFEYNGFEQISINFVNEKLQQFFNHHMFVVEQEEYISEGIDWVMVDFGMDLAACIIMFEKPMGIWAILEEESNFPKASDKTLEDKLKATHLGKTPTFDKPKSKTDKNAHFAIIHYAGTVSYNVTGWLEKNKDPVNDTVVDVLKRGSSSLMKLLWADHPGQSGGDADDGKKKKKKGGGKTVSSVYLVQLNELMTTLHNTEPHFIRCIVPNQQKKPLFTETPLILHQLTCNGVLEGIRICMRGFPNRVLYPEFKHRYQVLARKEMEKASDNKAGVCALMDKIQFNKEIYRLGHTKVFFRAGALAKLEEARDDLVLKFVRWLQGEIRGRFRRKEYQKRHDRIYLMNVIQRNFRKFFQLRNWGWFIIIQKTKPLIGAENLEDQLRTLEAECEEKYGTYKKALDEKKRLQQENEIAKDEIQKLTKQLEAEQGDIAQYTERQTKASAAKAELESELHQASNQLSRMEQERAYANDVKKKLDVENTGIRKEIEDIDLAITKIEQEKANRDHHIRNLNDDIANQDEVINKLNKEKKNMGEHSSKASEDLNSAGSKYEHLNGVKNKLEATLDQLEDSVCKEKRARADVEKKRRALEGELKIAQDVVMDLEQKKKDIENIIARKEKDISGLATNLEGEQGSVSKNTRAIKESQARVEEMEQELEAERQARTKAERQRSDLARELEHLEERFVEAGGATSAQIELNKKRDIEIQKLRKDLEEASIQHETVMMNLKRKHQDATAEMGDQIDQLAKMKGKMEKDISSITHELNDVRVATDEISRARASAEKSNKNLLSQLNELNKRVEEANLTLGDMDHEKKKMHAECGEVLRTVQELENNHTMLSKYKQQLASSLEDAKRVADDEAKDRQVLLGKYKNLEHELDGTKALYDEEIVAKDDVLRKLAKATQEAELWKQKYDKEALAKAEELEMSKLKLQARLSEAEGTTEQLQAKLSQIEKAKMKLKAEIDDVAAQADQAHILNSQMEKKAKQFDRIVGEWKQKADGLSMDLDRSQAESRNASAELFRVKSAYEEGVLQLDEVRKENKNLSNEIKDIMDQISEGGRSIHEIDKICKRLDSEKRELQAALEEAEGALEQEENKNLRAQLELTQLRQEIERRIAEKEEEFESTRKNFQKAIENMSSAVEQEAKGKAEAVRMKKKLEADVSELEMALGHSNAANLESQKTIKRYHAQIREFQMKLEDEQRAKAVCRDQLIAADRRAHSNKNALEEAKTLLDQCDRQRRIADQELSDTNEQLSELTCTNQAINASNRKLDSELGTLKGELDEMVAEANMSEEKAKRAMVDAARLAEELRCEQDVAQVLDKDRKLLECQLKDAQTRLDEAETNALKGGKKAMNKMETRIRELTSEIQGESRRLADSQKNLRKSERHLKELTCGADEDRKNHERIQSLIDQFQMKIKSYKKQIEEAEEIAALNLAKYRQTQLNLGESEERADLNEQALAKLKATARSESVGL